MAETIMIVDDSESMRAMLAYTLENSGYTVVEAENGLEARSKLETSSVSMLIVDLYMPFLDGFELTRAVRSMNRYRQTPIIMLTTANLATTANEARAAGATCWIPKPFKPELLLGMIETLSIRHSAEIAG